ncbi:Chromosome partition protein MukE [Cupriavidus yeoncheonensis]|uniref:Chromosome partition protein MukE n=1 Tax=Cupriavidus yeoncheonensis TaxID=1462994 RepID=A0A916NGB5_9BURK|nr:chromosome partition protein MukE [Cupriavidus yeoncheonensis]CAG2158301.1 Chromosome partition protein MukE [Cupriavidus yeoncheonensis]
MATELIDVLSDERYPQADLELRQGRHIGTDADALLYDFIKVNQEPLNAYYKRYGATLQCGAEGYYYLLPQLGADKAPLGRRHLSMLEMLVGQTLALMMLDPEWLETNRRIPDERVRQMLEQLLGKEKLLQFARRRRGKDDERDAQKLRASISASLETLERLGFVKRAGRGDHAVVIPLTPITRFADPVRSTGVTADTLRRLIQEGEIADLADEDKADDDASNA